MSVVLVVSSCYFRCVLLKIYAIPSSNTDLRLCCTFYTQTNKKLDGTKKGGFELGLTLLNSMEL